MDTRALPIRYLSGEASDQEIAALEQWILQSPANALLFAECATDELNLPEMAKQVYDQAESGSPDATFDEDLFKALLPTEPLKPVDITQSVIEKRRAEQEAAERKKARLEAIRLEAVGDRPPHIIIIPHAAVWLATAAMVGLVAWLGISLFSSSAPSNPQTAATGLKVFATIDSASDAIWSDPSAVANGLESGVEVELLSGVAELRFDQGATVLVEGPAALTATGSNTMRLKRGRLVAEVPPSAVGFEIDTRYGLVRDYGTEFGLSVDEQTGLQTRVFKGEIGVAPRSVNSALGAETKLRDNEAAKISPDSPQVVALEEPEPSQYLRREAYSLLIKPDPSPAERWQAHLLKLERGGNLIAHLGFSEDAMQMKRGPAGANLETQWIDGKIIPVPGNRRGLQAVRLEGSPDQGIDLRMPGHPGYDKLTFIAWARVEPIPGRTNAPLLHHSRVDMPRSTPNWQLRPDLNAIHVNQFAKEGTTQSSRRVAASLDGIVWEQWHCYAVVLDARTGQCDHYLDGRWVGSGELEQKEPLRLDGLRISSTGREVTDHPRTIKGEIGMFTFLNTALDAEMIRQSYDASRPLFH